MFIGISFSELFSVWEYVLPIMIVISGLLLGFVFFVTPILNMVWCYIDRKENKGRSALNFLDATLGRFLKEEVWCYKGVQVKEVDQNDAKRAYNGVKVSLRLVDGYYIDSYNVDKKHLSLEKVSVFNDVEVENCFILCFSILAAISFGWPLLVIGLSLFLPVYLLRAARDGQKLAIKVANHVADEKVHNKGE